MQQTPQVAMPDSEQKLRIPKCLAKSPIIDCVAEIRYEGSQDIMPFIPGLLRNGLGEEITMHQTHPIPPEIIKTTPGMETIPTFAMSWGNYTLQGNHGFIAIGHRPPYTNWATFKTEILKVFGIIISSNMISSISRHSLKYANFIGTRSHAEALAQLNLQIHFQKEPVSGDNFSLTLTRPHGKFFNIIKLASSVSFNNNNKIEEGIGSLIDIDTIENFEKNMDPMDFQALHSSLLDGIHDVTEKMFFATITEATIQALEPSYE